MKKFVVVEYRARKIYCQCCDQKLPNPKTSELREFKISKELIVEYGDWKESTEYEDDFQAIVEEYVYETISFFAGSLSEKLLIENSEIDKVKQFILDEIVV